MTAGAVLVSTFAPPASGETLDEARAAAAAPVLAEDEGDEYTLVYDNHDGTSTAKIHARPQRVSTDAGWSRSTPR